MKAKTCSLFSFTTILILWIIYTVGIVECFTIAPHWNIFTKHSCNSRNDDSNRILLIVEPTPFNYISGYANRFKETLSCMKSLGCSVQIITTDNSPNPPTHYLEYPISTLKGFQLPMYKAVSMSFDPFFNIAKKICCFKPHLIHVSSPSFLCISAMIWSKVFDVPLLMSYHTDISAYAKSYFPFEFVPKFIDYMLNKIHGNADLVLCTSPQLKEKLRKNGLERIEVWRKGINTEVLKHF